ILRQRQSDVGVSRSRRRHGREIAVVLVAQSRAFFFFFAFGFDLFGFLLVIFRRGGGNGGQLLFFFEGVLGSNCRSLQNCRTHEHNQFLALLGRIVFAEQRAQQRNILQQRNALLGLALVGTDEAA